MYIIYVVLCVARRRRKGLEPFERSSRTRTHASSSNFFLGLPTRPCGALLGALLLQQRAAMRRILLLAALAAADDHIHASHADIELARDFRVDKHHKIIVSNIGDEDLAFYYLGNEGNQGMEHPEPTWDMSETLCAVLGPDEEAGRVVRLRD